LLYGEETAAKLNSLSNREERGAQLDAEIARTDKNLRERCRLLSQRRAKAAKELLPSRSSEMRDLAMEKTRFEVLYRNGRTHREGDGSR